MSDKKETPVSWLVEQVKSKEFTNDMYSWHKEEVFKKALEMESKKQQKYDEMLEMLIAVVLAFEHKGMGKPTSLTELIKKAKEL
jgi:UDP-N-acetyl-D-mannosaminuronate dehydrogenase